MNLTNVTILTTLLSWALLWILCEPRRPFRELRLFSGCILLGCCSIFLIARSRSMELTIASTLFLAVPTFLWGGYLAQYRGARFVFTFCTIAILGVVILTLSEMLTIWLNLPVATQLLWYMLFYALMFALAWQARPRYLSAQASLTGGWSSMALLALAFYAVLCLAVSYPVPLVQRPVYFPVIGAYLLAIGLVYCVLLEFIQHLLKKCEFEQNTQLLEMQLELQNSQLKEKELYYQLAYVDSMTQVHNRTAYTRDQGWLLTNWEQATPLACVMFDLDNLKEINDTLGHDHGDQLICALAQILIAQLGGREHIYRMGGDEFLIILPQADELMLEDLLYRLQAAIAYYNRSTAAQPLSVAIGSAITRAAASEAIAAWEYVRQAADRKMYEDKAYHRLIQTEEA